MDALIYILPAFGLLALIYMVVRSSWVGKQDPGDKKMVDIGDRISKGAMAFLRAEYRILAIFVAVVAILLAVSADPKNSSWMIGVSFVVGAICSALAGFIGMRVATKANIRTTQAARTGQIGRAHV